MERVELTRECEGVQVPAGTKMTLEKGLEVFITQSLGGTYTVQVPAYAGLFRISGKDADALGKTPEQATEAASGDVESMVWEQLKEGSLTARPTSRACAKAGLSDPVVLCGRAIAQRIKGTPGITG